MQYLILGESFEITVMANYLLGETMDDYRYTNDYFEYPSILC
jgi:hypothetical protein